MKTPIGWLPAIVSLALAAGYAQAAGTYILTTVNTFNPFSPTGTAVVSGPVPTAGAAIVNGSGNVSGSNIQWSFVNVSSTHNYTNGVWSAVVGGTSIAHTETCTELAGAPCTGQVSGLIGIWNSTQQSGGAATGTCSASSFFAAGNCDRVAILETPGVSLTIIEQSEFPIPALPYGYIYRFVPTGCADFAIQVVQGSSNNTIVAPSRCLGFAGPVTLSILSLPAHGTASSGPGSSIVYTPNAGYVGPDTLVYQGTDGATTDQGVASINVADISPDPFLFVDQTEVPTNVLILSNAITVTGITGAAPISILGGSYTVNAGPVNFGSTTVSNGDTVVVGLSSSSNLGTTSSATLSIGGVSDTFSITTLGINSDTDGDGVADQQDNCTVVSNPGQLDADGDGYGNICDADLNNSGLVTSADYALLRPVLGQAASFSSMAAAADLNGSGTVTTADFGLLRARLGTLPGPRGSLP